MAKITLLGIGGALAPYPDINTNGLITLDNGDQYLIDCGQSFPQIAKKKVVAMPCKCHGGTVYRNPIDLEKIKGVFLTHCHGDHMGGMEFLGFYAYFFLKRKLKIYTSLDVKEDFQNIIFNSMRFINDEVLETPQETFDHYFEFYEMPPGEEFEKFQGSFYATSFDVRHCIGMPSVGFKFMTPESIVIWSGDSNEAVYTEKEVDNWANDHVRYLVFQDCAIRRNSNVHAGFEELPCPKKAHGKLKVVLMHYGNGDVDRMEKFQSEAIKSGFEPGKPFQSWEI